jgi:hypothetical protein
MTGPRGGAGRFDKAYSATCIDRGDCWYGDRRKVIGTLSFRR